MSGATGRAGQIVLAAVSLLTLPLSLAWLAVRLLVHLGSWSPRPVSPLAVQALPQLVLVGPALETVQLMLAAALVGRLLAQRRPDAGRNILQCAGIVAFAFIASHVALRGIAALASLPMALLLSGGAVLAVGPARTALRAAYGLILYVVHAWYNAALLVLGGA